ncbi:hypothetical protein RNJ44_02414 [Nakaseomyces bracarensis]|uniref:Uncharacterized protein n=1 Tax=Nakaseomyces bracarensis TaxID=273131 RepID=A0ABR4NLM8_9SACH
MSDNKMNREAALVDLEKASETTEDEGLIENSLNEKKTISTHQTLGARIRSFFFWMYILFKDSSNLNLFKFSEGPRKSIKYFNNSSSTEIAITLTAFGVFLTIGLFGTIHYYRLVKNNSKRTRDKVFLCVSCLFASYFLEITIAFPCVLLVRKYPILCDWPYYLIKTSWSCACLYGLDQLVSPYVVKQRELV